jgi:zinc D-Ala-D-Ala carboxypeptidase
VLKVKPKKRHIILAGALVTLCIATAGVVYAIIYYGDQAIARQESTSKAHLAKLDKKIEEIEAKKLAEKKAKEEAERKAREKAKKEAAQTAAAEAALQKQLAGQTVTPAGCAISGAHGNPASIDVVVNKKRCFSPINYVPADIVYYQGYPISNKIYSNLVAMINAAAAAGKSIGLTSAYRSYDNQVATYNHWVSVNGSTAAADQVSARPGYSEHQTGFAVDVSSGGAGLEAFANTAAYTWMTNNAHKYGFVQRYKPGYEAVTGYSAEAWHWRFVGTAAATDMKTKGIHTLEQYWGLPGGGY